jgi:PAS domain S-box-containing protein
MVNITRLKQAEMALVESEHKFRSLFQFSPQPTTLTEMETGRIIDVNDKFCELTKCARKEVLGRTVTELRYRSAKDRSSFVEELKKSGEIQATEEDFTLKDGSILHTLMYAKEIELTGKSYILSIFIDITEAKHVGDRLRESEERYRSLVENIDFGVNLIDTDYSIVMANTAQSKMLERPISEMVGKKCYRIFEQRDAVCSHCPGKRALATHQAQEVETTGVRDDGECIDVRVLAFPAFGPDGAMKGFVEIVEDITARKRAEQALREREKELEATNAQLEEMNAALKVLLTSRENDKTELEEKVLFNVRQMASPYLEKLKRTGLDSKQSMYADILEANLAEIISPLRVK